MKRRALNRTCAFLLVGVLASSVVCMGYSEARSVKAFDFVLTPAIAYEVIATLLAACGITIGGIAFDQNRDKIEDAFFNYAENEYNLTRDKMANNGIAMDTFTDFISKAYEKGKVTVDDAVSFFIDSMVNDFSYSTVLPDYSFMEGIDDIVASGYEYVFVSSSQSVRTVYCCARKPLVYYEHDNYEIILIVYPPGTSSYDFDTMIRKGDSGEWLNGSGFTNGYFSASSLSYINFPVYNSRADALANYELLDTTGFVDFDPLGLIQQKLDEMEKSLSDLNFGSVNDVGELTHDIPLVDPDVWADVADDVITWDDVIDDNKIVIWDPVTDMPVVGELPDVIDPDKPIEPEPDPDNPSNPDNPSGGFDKGSLTADLSKLFPFCIPFDLVRAIKVFNQKPETPHFEWTLEIAPLDYSYTFVIDLKDFNSVAVICRSMFLLLFIVGLIMSTRALIRG